MSKGARERERLFNLYSRNLSFFQSEYPDAFACPLCDSGYSREALTVEPPSVSLAHVIPESLGGSLKTLTCTPTHVGKTCCSTRRPQIIPRLNRGEDKYVCAGYCLSTDPPAPLSPRARSAC
jgi:hypothetical protein